MAASTDFTPLAWKETESGQRPLMWRAPRARVPERLSHPHEHQAVANLPPERQEELRANIRRGREYLEQVTRELRATQEILEDWPVYEKHCGANPLAQLTRTLVEHQHMADFLAGWLKRQEARLALCIQPREPRHSRARREDTRMHPAHD